MAMSVSTPEGGVLHMAPTYSSLALKRRNAQQQF